MSDRTLTSARAGGLGLAVLTLTLMSLPAEAAGMAGTSCIGYWGSLSCIATWRPGVGDPHIRFVPEPATDAEAIDSRRRERRWRDLCRPEIRQDRFGVEHYVYAKPGCEFGRYQ
jgi:hypothetical protein